MNQFLTCLSNCNLYQDTKPSLDLNTKDPDLVDLPIKRPKSEISNSYFQNKNKGYAKLFGTEFSCLIQDTEVVLGRGISKDNFIGLGNCKQISRKQAKIYWEPDLKSFVLKNIGKNSIIADKKYLGKNETIKLNSKTPIKIGPVCFYFLLPL
jgi:FHA domain